MKNLACFLALLFLVLGQWTLNSHRAQAQGLLNPVVVDSFPQIITGGNSNGGETAVGMQGSCFTLPCCSVNVYKVVLPSNGVLRVEMAGFVPLAGTIIAYQPTVATPTAYSDLEYVAGTPGNFCGFRDTLQLGRAYNNWDLTPFGQVPDRTVLFELYDINNPSPFAGFFPAGDYYLLVFNGNQQIGFGVGTPYDLSFEFIQACEVLDVPASLSFANLEPNTGTDTLGFYLTNNRMLPVSIDTGAGLVISGADASEFSILTYPDTNLAVGDSTLMEVVFAPSSGGSKTAQLTISYADSACSADNTINLSGIGNEPNISILGNGVSITNNSSSFSLNNFTNMGAVVVNTGAITRSYTIQNSGTDTLELSGMPAVAMQAGSQFSLTPPSSTSLLPGASTTFSVTFTPTNIGLDTAQFTITNNDSNQDPFTFQVMAAGAGLNGLDFDGSGDYVNIDVIAGDMVGQNIFTVESWVKIDPAQSGNDILLGVNTSSNGARMFILMDDGIWELWVGTTVRNLNGPDIRDDAWHHVAFVYNNGTVNYYLDGTLQDTETNNVPSFNANDQWSIGQEWDNSGASDFFNGAVNEFRIWKTARTAAEVAGGRYCEANGLNTDLVAYYSFNQGVAGVSNTNISTLTDGSTNGFDGALNGFALNGTESNFILADNVAPACTSFQLQVCDAPTYTTPSGMVIDTNGLIADTIPNSLGGDSALLIDLTIDYTVVSQSNLSDTSFCGGSAYTGQMSTNLSSTYNFVKANSDYVTMDAVRDSLVNTNRSIFLWMRAAGTVDGDNQVLVGINTSGSSSVSIFGIRTNEQLWIFDGGNSRNSGVTVTDGNWHFVGYTYDEGSNQTQFWVDGVEAASFSNGQSISATSRISLGQEWDSSTPSDFFDGEMAEVSFWNEVLDSADIVAIMQSAITNAHPKYSNLVAYYPGNGECGVDGFSISDFGPNDYDGTATATSILNTDSLVVLPGFDPTSHYDLSVRMNGSVVATGNPFTIASTTNGAHVGALEKGYFAIYDTFNITSFPDPVAVINQGDSAFFAMGDSVQLTTTAQNGVAYEWFKGFDEDWRFIGPRGFSPGATNKTRAQVGPDGTIYAAFQDEANGDGISVMRYDGIAWQFVGSPGFSAGAVGDIDFKIAPDSTLYVAFEDKFTGGSGSNGKATVMYFDGAAWQTLGTTEFSAGGLIHISLEISQQDTVYVGYTDIANLNRGTVQRFNGTAWENVGPAGFTAGFAGPVDLGIAPDGTLYFGFGDITSGPATTVMTFDGTNWQILGTPGFSDQSDGSRTTSIAFDPAGVPYVGAVGGDNPFFVEVFRFDGNDWAQLDTALVNGSNPSYNAVAINPTGTVYTSSVFGTNSANRAPTVWQLTGSGWQPVGNPNFVFSQAIEGSLDFGVDGNPIYIFRDNRLLNGIGNRATAMRFGPEYLVNGTDVFASDTGNYILVAANSQGCTARDTIRVEQTIAQALLASAAVDSNASCNSFSDGGVTTTAIGGTTPYTYNWSNSATTASITGVVAGTYTVTITDASGATGTASATITEPSAILVNTVVDSNASCNGFLDGGATASASGGTAPYTYLWSNSATTASITGVAAGMYTVSITDNNGCGPATATATITEPLALVAATVEDSSATCGTCSDGGATASATGGTMPYSYTWSNSATTSSITGVLPGTYSVTITDNNGCTDSSSITIATGLSAAIVVDSNVSCFGFATGGATATVSSGATPYTYLWSNAATSSAITGLVAGVYTVTVTDAGGLTASASASITQPTLLSASLVGTTNVSCNGLSDGSITTLANGGTAPYTYNWNNGDTIASLSGIVAGTYTLTLTDANGCSATFSQSISEPTAIVASNANILPDCGISNGAVDISISGGAAPYTHLWSNGATTEDIASIPAGTYTITITDNSGCTTTANYNVNNINGANASSVVTEPLCNGDNNGSIDVTTSGGTAPYTYAWSTGASTEDLNTLADGTYTLTITDATGCLTLLTDTLEEPAELQGDIAAFATAITPVSCSGGNDGAINLPIIGGTMPYSYLWSTGDTTQIVSNLSAGGYLVTVTDANGCTTGGPLTVPELSGMSLATNTTAATDYTTADGSATATVTNGTAPYTYLWSNSGTTATITGIPSGAYTVIVTDANGCSVEGYSYVGVVPSGCQTTLDWTQLGADEALMLPNYSTNGIDINLSFIESGGAGEDDNFSFEHDERGNIDTVGFVQLDMNPSSNNDPNQFNQLVIDFSAPVRNLSFAVTDIDAASSYADSMQVAAYDANGNVLTGFFNFVGDSIAFDYSSDTLQAVGLGNSDNSQDFGNAGIVYPDSVSQLVVWQRTGRSGASNPGSHRIYVSALTFENDYQGVYDDNVAVTENDSIVIDVQANDALTCHAPQTTSVLSSPLFGTATVLGNDSIRYTPNPKFYGIDSLHYQVCDNNGLCDSAWVFVSVLPELTDSLAWTLNNADEALANDSQLVRLNRVDFTFSDPANIDASDNFTIESSSTRGQFVPASYLSFDINANSTTAPNEFVEVTMDFEQAVNGLYFHLIDVDNSSSGGGVDSVVVSAIGPNGQATPVYFFDAGPATTTFQEGASRIFYGIGESSSSSESFANAGVYVPDSVTQIVITYDPPVTSDGDGNPASQSSYISNLHWRRALPEIRVQNENTLIANQDTVPSTADSTDFGSVFLGDSLAVTYTIFNTGNDTLQLSGPVSLSGANASEFSVSSAPATSVLPGDSTDLKIQFTPTTAGLKKAIVSIGNNTICDPNYVFHLRANAACPSFVASAIVDSNATCNGFADGGATANLSGGTAPLTYTWSNSATTASITGVVAGTYSVTITDVFGCQDSASVTISEPTAVNAATVVDSNATCNGFANGGVTVTASGGTSPYTYTWSNAATTASITGVGAGAYTVTVTDNNGCTTSASASITEPALLTLSTAVDSTVLCNGFTDGGATAMASGGTAPYTYLWSNSATTGSITGVGAGTYSVTVTDNNGCSTNDSVSISEPPALIAATVVDSNATCNGFLNGGATAAATGGTAPYSFLWSNSATTASITGVAAGTYSVTITDNNGCTDSSSVIVSEPAALVAATVIDSNVSCNGFTDGGATASATGGVPPYTYLWSNSTVTASITGVMAGTYTVTITDNNGCTSTDTATVTEPTVLSLAIVVDSNESCAGALDGGLTTASVGGTMPYTYAWSNGGTTAVLTGLAAGVYSVTVTDANGCSTTGTDTILLQDATAPTVLTQSLTIYLDSAGQVALTVPQVDSGTFDACGLDTLYLNRTTFNCSDVGSVQTVQLIAVDINGNTDSAAAQITVADTLVPGVLTQNLTVYLDTNGQASITAAMIDNGSFDNCGVDTLMLDSTQFDCSETGTNTVSLTVTDVNGNSNSATAVVTVLDTIAPAVQTQNLTVYLDSNGQASITAAMVDNGSTDNCAVASLALDSTQFDCAEVGTNTVMLTVTDSSGNSSTDSAIVTVLDTLAPMVNAQNITVYLDSNGQVSITTAMVDSNSLDNCGILSLSLDSTQFDCGEVGANTVTLTVTDVNGNSDSTTATVTVLDTLAPVVQTQNLTIYLDGNGQASITAAMVNDGSTDNCAIDTLTLDSTLFDCSEVGANNVVLTVSDIYGNSASASAVVTVLDTLRPQLIVANDTAVCAVDTNGTVVSYSNSATDNCGTTTINQLSGLPSGSIFPIGITTNVFEAVDASGNITLDSFTIEVYSIPALSMSAINGLCETADPVALNASPAGGVFSGSGVSGTSFDPTAVTPGNHELTYTFTTTQGCSYSTSVFAEVFANPLVQLGSFPDTICIELGQVAAPVATPAGGVYSGLGIDSILLNTQVAGIGQHWITYTYVDANGCVGTDSTLANIDQCLPPLDVANPIDAAATWSVFPNPSQGNFRVQHNFRVSVSARVFALDGSLVQEIPQLISGQEIHLEQQGSGVYFLQLTGDEVNEIKRIVVQ